MSDKKNIAVSNTNSQDEKMSDVSKKDIPEVDSIKNAVIEALDSGRPRGTQGIEKEVCKILQLSSNQKKYKIKGSSTTLFSNRYKDALRELKKENLICESGENKLKLTSQAKTAKTTNSVNSVKLNSEQQPSSDKKSSEAPTNSDDNNNLSKNIGKNGSWKEILAGAAVGLATEVIKDKIAEKSEKENQQVKSDDVNCVNTAQVDEQQGDKRHSKSTVEQANTQKDDTNCDNEKFKTMSCEKDDSRLVTKLDATNSNTSEHPFVKYIPWIVTIFGLFFSIFANPVLGLVASACACGATIYLSKKKKVDVFFRG